MTNDDLKTNLILGKFKTGDSTNKLEKDGITPPVSLMHRVILCLRSITLSILMVPTMLTIAVLYSGFCLYEGLRCAISILIKGHCNDI